MKKRIFLFVTIFASTILFFTAGSVGTAVAAGLGENCYEDSDCGGNACAYKYKYNTGICMPATISSDITVNINHIHPTDGDLTTGYVQYKNSGGQAYFNNAMLSAEWVWLEWSDFVCGQKIYRYSDAEKYYYKGTDGTKFWYGERNEGSSENIILNALDHLVCKTAVQKKVDGSVCSSASECSGNYCVHGKCRSASAYCGDSYCDSGETCSSCPSDCGACQPVKSPALNFSADGGTQDAGTVTSSEGAYTWAVTLPDNFTKVETIHYDKNNLSNMRKYMGWNGILKANGDKVWEFKNWSSSTGGIIYDGSLGQEVKESTGVGLWIDATKFFKVGSNTVTFSHFNEGAGIGLKIKVTTGEVKKSDSSTCSLASECLNNYCVHGKCRSYFYFHGDNYCDRAEGEECASPDCASHSDCVAAEGSICSTAADCPEMYCVHNKCRASHTYCGDGYCDADAGYGESCSNCPADCGACKKPDGSECKSASECKGGYCVYYFCRSSAAYCGDKSCDGNETCEDCQKDCGLCKNKNGEKCVKNSECLSDFCLENICRPKDYAWCGDKICQSGEDCSCLDCKKDPKCQAQSEKKEAEIKTIKEGGKEPKKETKEEAGKEVKMEVSEGMKGVKVGEKEEPAVQIPEKIQNLMNEYAALGGEIGQLKKKINVSEVKMEVSADDMHIAIHELAKDLLAEKKYDKIEALLKNVIPAEKLAIATYHGEAEMAQMLAESSWQSFKVYLLSKIQVMMGDQLEKLAAEGATDLARQIKDGYGQLGNPAEELKKLGFADTAAIVEKIDKAFRDSQGDVSKYLENIESQIRRQTYVDAYIEMFNDNFKEAIASQLVYYQVAAWHYTENIKVIPNADVPFKDYQKAINDIKKEIGEEKQFISGNNIFAKATELNDKLTEGVGEMDKILGQAGALASAVDKGASLLGKESQVSDIVEALGEYNKALGEAVDYAAETLEIAGKFAESAYGTYKEAKLYSVFFNAYDKWYDSCLGGSVTVLRIPLTDKKIDITSVYKLFKPLVGTGDKILTEAGKASDYLVSGAKAVADVGVEAVKAVGQTLNTKIVQGLKTTQKIVSVGKTLVYAVKWTGLLGYAPENGKLSLVNAACAREAVAGPMAELTLISPSGLRFAGRPYADNSGVYVAVNNPEKGEWTAEIIAKEEVKTEQPVEIITNAEQKDLGEINKEAIEKEEAGRQKEIFDYPQLKWVIPVIIALLLALIIWRFKIWKKRINS